MKAAYTFECVVMGSGYTFTMTSFDFALIGVTALISAASMAIGFYLLRTCGSDRQIDDALVRRFVETARQHHDVTGDQGQQSKDDKK